MNTRVKQVDIAEMYADISESNDFHHLAPRTTALRLEIISLTRL